MLSVLDLNSKQTKILELLITGMSDKEIASQLGHTQSTIRLYLHVIFETTGIHGRVPLAVAYVLAKVEEKFNLPIGSAVKWMKP